MHILVYVCAATRMFTAPKATSLIVVSRGRDNLSVSRINPGRASQPQNAHAYACAHTHVHGSGQASEYCPTHTLHAHVHAHLHARVHARSHTHIFVYVCLLKPAFCLGLTPSRPLTRPKSPTRGYGRNTGCPFRGNRFRSPAPVPSRGCRFGSNGGREGETWIRKVVRAVPCRLRRRERFGCDV